MKPDETVAEVRRLLLAPPEKVFGAFAEARLVSRWLSPSRINPARAGRMGMIALPVTSIIAAILAIIMFPLTLQVSTRRLAVGSVVFGDGGDETLRRRIRAFGNFVEYVPICLILLVLIEFQGARPLWLWITGGLLVAGRVIHALGMLFATSPAPRGIAMMMTYGAFLVPAAWLLLNLRS